MFHIMSRRRECVRRGLSIADISVGHSPECSGEGGFGSDGETVLGRIVLHDGSAAAEVDEALPVALGVRLARNSKCSISCRLLARNTEP